ncbi:MAG: hypothetical protein HY075_14775 [Deltaproteobacteria bacterium]|nr:hypothetical protein [Deltaproteobacteria bacterium]
MKISILAAALALMVWCAPARADDTVDALVATANPASESQPDLSANWLDGGKVVTQAHLERLMAIVKRDPETAEILKTAQDALGAPTSGLLLKFVEVCPNNGNAVGLADVEAKRYMESRSIYEVLGTKTADHRASILKDMGPRERLTRYDEALDYVAGETVYRGAICIVADSSLREAIYTFIHELTHIGRMTDRVDPVGFLDDFADSKTYVQVKLLDVGGEFEANYWEYRILISNINFLYGIINNRQRADQPIFGSDVRRAAHDSLVRLNAEVDRLLALRDRYHARFPSEGISVTTTTTVTKTAKKK